MGLKSFFQRFTKSRKQGNLRSAVTDMFDINVTNIQHFEEAIIHRSVSDGRNNERLEYLGDAVLDLIVADLLFRDYPDLKEGELTKLKSRLVSRENFRRIGMSMSIAELLPLKKQHDLRAENIIGNVVEALFGAIYLDQGYGIAKDRALKMIDEHCCMEEMLSTMVDPKSELLEWAQKNRRKLKFSTQEVGRNGSPVFKAQILLDDQARWVGEGSSKKRAQMAAARLALGELSIPTV